MKRAVLSLAAGVFAVFAVLGIAGAAVAAIPPATLRADVNDFVFDSFSADYYLDTDADGRSILTTVETFVAVFPEIDQNHGMRRAIPGDYQGIPTNVSVQSVTDGDGNPRPFTVETDDDGFVLVTSREDPFVYGPQTYVFTYTQKNVTRFFADTNDDEFFWDTNGTGWAQPFGSVSVRVHIPTELADSLTGQNACYQGYEGSTTQCELETADEADGVVISADVESLQAYQNVSLAIGFEPQTFVPRDDSFLASPAAFLQIFSVIAAVVAAIWALVLRATRLGDGTGRPTIIAEYSPPKNIDLVTAAVILGKTKRAAAAQFVDFAVKRKIRIIETEKQGWFSRGTTYLLELIDPSGLDGPELNLAQALFGYSLQPGTGYLMTSSDTALSQHVRSIIASATSAASRDGLRKRGSGKYVILPTLLALLGAVGTFVFGVTMLDDSVGGAIPFLLFIPALIGVLIVFGTIFRTPLSDQGAELRDHLKGLELYIRLAEADRLKMLQSPTGAQREAISTSDPRQVVDVYEKLLPYAVLFNLEKEWAQELGKYYVDSPPDYYSGSTAFNASIFASSISSMSTAAASSYSGSSSSSSSGGSGGGGSSGGGGGGGGGGGV